MRHLQYKKVCEFCGKDFISQKSSTRFCSQNCARLAYKAKMREESIRMVESDTARQKQEIQREQTREVMCVSMAAQYLGISRSTLYRYLQSGMIRCLQLSRKTLIKRSTLDELLEGKHPYIYIKGQRQPEDAPEPLMTVRDVAEKYDYSLAGAHKLLSESGIQKIRDGNLTFYPESKVKAFFARRRQKTYENITEWYTVKEIMEKFGKTSSYVYTFASRFGIPTRRIDKVKHYSKRHIDKLMSRASDTDPADYYTCEEAMEKFDLTRDQVYWIVGNRHIPSVRIFKYASYDRKLFDEAVSSLNYRQVQDAVPTIDESRYLTVKQIMETFRMSQNRVYTLVSEWRIPKKTIKGKGYYERDSVEYAVANPGRKPSRESLPIIDTAEHYTIKQMMEKYGLSTNQAYSFVSERRIIKTTVHGIGYYDKGQVDDAMARILENRKMKKQT